MTGRPGPRPSVWPAAASLMLALAAVALAVAVGGRVLSRAFVVDLVSLWPVAALALVALAVAVSLRRRHPRLLALPALLALTWLLLAGGLHLARWEPLPSASLAQGRRDLVEQVTSAALEVTLDRGEVTVRPGRHGGYLVQPILTGGEAGPPVVAQAVGETSARVVVSEREAGDWYGFGGWEVSLSPSLRWTLGISSPGTTADLAGLALDSLTLIGSGSAVLGAPDVETPVLVEGSYRLAVPADVPVRVIGSADVPDDWVETPDGAASPLEGPGWVVTVGGEGSLVVDTL